MIIFILFIMLPGFYNLTILLSMLLPISILRQSRTRVAIPNWGNTFIKLNYYNYINNNVNYISYFTYSYSNTTTTNTKDE
jgi:hypothetical protein